MHFQSPHLLTRLRASDMQHPKPWKKLLTFLALIAIPAVCTALYTL